MANFQRPYDRIDTLPAIRHGSYTDPLSQRRITSFDDIGLSGGYRRPVSPTAGLLGGYRDTSPAAALLRSESPRLQPRPPSPTGYNRKSVIELEEQLRKKDTLIQQLSRFDSPGFKPVRSFDPVRPYDTGFMPERIGVDNRTEFAAIQVKCEKLQVQVRDMERELELRDIKIREMHLSCNSSQDTEARATGLVQTLRDRLAQLEAHAGSVEGAAGRSEFTISKLQKDAREQQDRILELEGRLGKHLTEKEEAEQKCHILERKYNELVSNFSNILHADEVIGFLPGSIESLVTRLTEMVQENAMLKGKLVTVNEMLSNVECETKASRETIMRLVSEMGREQKISSRYTTELENLRVDRDNALASRRDLEHEIKHLRERLDTTQRTFQDIQHHEPRRTDYRDSSSHVDLVRFREQLATILSDSYHAVEPYEEAIKERVRQLHQTQHERSRHIENLETKIHNMGVQIDNRREFRHSSTETDIQLADMEARLRIAEGDLVTGDVLRDGIRGDTETCLRALQRLGEVMKMDRISLDLGLDLTMDALISRAHQLMKLEADTLANRSSQLYNLQRKVKSLKEQLDSKDLHLELLRKKLTGMDERLLNKSSFEKERDIDYKHSKKLERLVEKYKLQSHDAKQEAVNLKAQLLGASEMRMRTMEQKNEIEELVQQVDELEQIRQKQARKIAGLKQHSETHGHEYQEKQVIADNAVHALSSELRTTKHALDSLSNREKQLLDFRNVVARMLGLEINTLAVPDYEIISRLEKLIQAHHSQAFTTSSLEEAMHDMEDNFMSGYDSTRRNLTGGMQRKSRDRARRQANVRARSLSPQRRRDPRSY